MITTWPAPAKLNLFLYITGRRADGYHNLQTLFQFLDVGDTLEITPDHSGSITLLTPLDGVADEDNLIVRAALSLRAAAADKGTLPPQAGARIALEKRLPMGGGLGGGSSDAATVLVALNHLWRTQLSVDELATLGVRLGADVPVFVHGHAAFAEGVGEQLQPASGGKMVSGGPSWRQHRHPGSVSRS